MRDEEHFGRKIVCGHMFPVSGIVPGQKWQSSSGNIVTVQAVKGDWVEYAWTTGEGHMEHEKDSFSFQCRYCLIVEES